MGIDITKPVYDMDLTELGFVDDTLETDCHIVDYLFYDIGRLMIKSKEGHGNDDIYIEDFFTIEKFINVIHIITDFKINT